VLTESRAAFQGETSRIPCQNCALPLYQKRYQPDPENIWKQTLLFSRKLDKVDNRMQLKSKELSS